MHPVNLQRFLRTLFPSAQESKKAAKEKAQQVAEEFREMKRRTRAIGAFPDGNNALILVYARFRYVAGFS